MWFFECWHQPIVPGRFQPSIVGTSELNFCVRYGNRWTLVVINTNYFAASSDGSTIISYRFKKVKRFFQKFQTFFEAYLGNKKTTLSCGSQCWHQPIVPGRFQPSIVGTSELNFCVRYGNRWTLVVINTNYFAASSDGLDMIPQRFGKCKLFLKIFLIFLSFLIITQYNVHYQNPNTPYCHSTATVFLPATLIADEFSVTASAGVPS